MSFLFAVFYFFQLRRFTLGLNPMQQFEIDGNYYVDNNNSNGTDWHTVVQGFRMNRSGSANAECGDWEVCQNQCQKDTKRNNPTIYSEHWESGVFCDTYGTNERSMLATSQEDSDPIEYVPLCCATSGSAGPKKNDLTTIYFAGSDKDLVMCAAMERIDVTGSSYVDVEFNQEFAKLPYDQCPYDYRTEWKCQYPVRTTGDFKIAFALDSSVSSMTVTVSTWSNVTNSWLHVDNVTKDDCTVGAGTTCVAESKSGGIRAGLNSETIAASPFGFIDSQSSQMGIDTILPGAFLEACIDFQILGFTYMCYKDLLVKTRTSASGGSLKDTGGVIEFEICGYAPTYSPSSTPTAATGGPTINPTAGTLQPTGKPSSTPTTTTVGPTTVSPTSSTGQPTTSPTLKPSVSPTVFPSVAPTLNPSNNPSTPPTNYPTMSPTETTVGPTNLPTTSPTLVPTSLAPSVNPSSSPSDQSSAPTGPPSLGPTTNPTTSPTGQSSAPTGPPTAATNPPLTNPIPTQVITTRAPSSAAPSSQAPTQTPSTHAPTTKAPSSSTSAPVTASPTAQSLAPTTASPTTPSAVPTDQPTAVTPAPTMSSSAPTVTPTGPPTRMPSVSPSPSPNTQPNAAPTDPIQQPTKSPVCGEDAQGDCDEQLGGGGSSSMDLGLLAGIVFGSLCFLLICTSCIYYWKVYRRNAKDDVEQETLRRMAQKAIRVPQKSRDVEMEVGADTAAYD